MAIRLCQACLHEIKEGDKLCNNCNVSVNRHATVIEVMSEYEGFSYVSNRYAFHDEDLNNYKHETLKDSKNSRLYPNNIQISKKNYEVNDTFMEEDDADFIGNLVKMVKNPAYYVDVLMGLVGAIILIIGDISAMYNNIYLYKSYDNNYVSYMCSLMIAIGLMAILIVLKHKKKYVLIPALASMTLLTFVLSNVKGVKSLGVGYYIMWLATVMLIISAVISNSTVIKKYFLEKADLIWILLTFFISLGLANTLNYYGELTPLAAEIKDDRIDTDMVNIPEEEVRTYSVLNNKMDIQLSLLDSYLVSFNNRDMIAVELSVYNKGTESIKLEEGLEIYTQQNGDRINYEREINGVSYFDMGAKNEKIKPNKCRTIFYGFYIEDIGDVKLKIIDKISKEKIIDQELTVNSQFYVTGDVSGLPDGASDIMDEAEKNKNLKYNIYFVKPNSWSDDVCAYVYYLDKRDKLVEVEKWPGKNMKYLNGYYSITYDKKLIDKARVIIVDKNNLENRFPEVGKGGVLLEGNINITPNVK